MSDNDDNPWGEIIYSYTREQAIADGVLIDLCAVVPSICHQIFPGVAVVCTEALWSLIKRAVANPKYGNDLQGVVWDVLWMSRGPVAQAISRKETEVQYQVIITGVGRQKVHTLKAMMSVTDNGKLPAITLMFPEED